MDVYPITKLWVTQCGHMKHTVKLIAILCYCVELTTPHILSMYFSLCSTFLFVFFFITSLKTCQSTSISIIFYSICSLFQLTFAEGTLHWSPVNCRAGINEQSFIVTFTPVGSSVLNWPNMLFFGMWGEARYTFYMCNFLTGTLLWC